MKVAIVHDYLHVYGGAEGVVNAIWELFPDADIYTATCDRDALDKAGVLKGANIIYPKWKSSFKGKLGKILHKMLIANLPYYFSNLDLSKYDLILSSSAHFAKGVTTSPNQLHISYIHTPPRFLYGYKGELRKRSYWYWKLLLWPLDTYLRFLDKKFAKKPDYLLCNSKEVQGRIKKIYNRDAKVINPFPEISVSEEEFLDAKNSEGKYYISLSRLAEYKHVDLAIKTCGENNIDLKVAGTGPEEEAWKKLAENYSSVEMMGFVSKEEKFNLYKNCKAMICAVEDEDFGMAPLEPMMFGKPVLCYKQGGYLETVNESVGVFFEDLSENALIKTIKEFEAKKFDADSIRTHAKSFSKERFQKEFIEFVNSKLNSR